MNSNSDIGNQNFAVFSNDPHAHSMPSEQARLTYTLEMYTQ